MPPQRTESSTFSETAVFFLFFFFNDTATTEIYTLSLHDALPIFIKGTAAASDVNLARVYMNSGFALTLIGETFCQGVILGGPPLTPAQVLDSAIARYKQALVIGAAAAAAGVVEGTKIVNAANVGLARTYLQKKDYANAATTAALVPAAFIYNAIRID